MLDEVQIKNNSVKKTLFFIFMNGVHLPHEHIVVLEDIIFHHQIFNKLYHNSIFNILENFNFFLSTS